MRSRKKVDGHQGGDAKESRADGSTNLIGVHWRLYERVKHALTEFRPPRRDPCVGVPSPALLLGEAVRARAVRDGVTARVVLLGRGERSTEGAASLRDHGHSRRRRQEQLARRGGVGAHNRMQRRSSSRRLNPDIGRLADQTDGLREDMFVLKRRRSHVPDGGTKVSHQCPLCSSVQGHRGGGRHAVGRSHSRRGGLK